MEFVNRDHKIAEAIHLELEIDAQLIIRGFQELQSLDTEHGVYFLSSQSLAQGLERMMKVILFLSNSIQQGEMKRSLGHDLEKLWQRVKSLDYSKPIWVYKWALKNGLLGQYFLLQSSPKKQ